ncbi:hypothetical protein [Dyadobacter sp. 676]|uniref:Uncharacterized protein n=1 Tax=Dyadobacter sp. 676 TaxID=3088362 RepID=A0AAU8FKB4_9BACT
MKKNLFQLWLFAFMTAISFACNDDDDKTPETIKLEDSWKEGWTSQKVLDLPKGQRPAPSVYLDQKYIDFHLAKFTDGATYLVTKKALDDYGRDTLGYPDNTQFVMTKAEMDAMLTKTNKDISKIEKELGIPADSWKGKEMVRISIPDPRALNVRMPSGNEMGANNLWLPGGQLPTGYSEAVVDRIPKGKYTETPL